MTQREIFELHAIVMRMQRDAIQQYSAAVSDFVTRRPSAEDHIGPRASSAISAAQELTRYSQQLAECAARLEQALLEHAQYIKRLRTELRRAETVHRAIAGDVPAEELPDGTEEVFKKILAAK